MNKRRTAGFAALAAGVAMMVGSAIAPTTVGAVVATYSVPLHNSTASNGTDCPNSVNDYWHFILAPNNGSYAFTSIVLNVDGTTYTFTGFPPIIKNGSQTDNVFVAVPAGKTLGQLNLSGSSATITGPDGSAQFNLSHLCDGTPVVDPTTTTTTVPATSTTTTVPETSTTSTTTSTTVPETTTSTTVPETTSTTVPETTSTTTSTTVPETSTTTTSTTVPETSTTTTSTTVPETSTTTTEVSSENPTTTTTTVPETDLSTTTTELASESPTTTIATTTTELGSEGPTTTARQLPRTGGGSASGSLLAFGVVLMLFGTALLTMSRRTSQA